MNIAQPWATGIDIGGTGIKAGIVNVATGELAFEQVRVPTPQRSDPHAVATATDQALTTLADRLTEHRTQGKVSAQSKTIPAPTFPDSVHELRLGVAFPGSIRSGVVTFVGNLDQAWVGVDIESAFTAILQQAQHKPVFLNDADAAGLAEMAFGAGRNTPYSSVLVTTLGTGIGTALFTHGQLYPYTELGHINVKGHNGEHFAAVSTKDREKLSYQEWATRLQDYYEALIALTNPELIIVGGWISTQHEKFLPLLDLPVDIVPAHLTKNAGIVGAAVAAVRTESATR